MSLVFASPGTPSMMQCPWQRIAMKICCMVWSRPTIWQERFWRSKSYVRVSWLACCISFSGNWLGLEVVTIMLLSGEDIENGLCYLISVRWHVGIQQISHVNCWR